MSTDLKTQIRDYVTHVEAGQEPVTVADVRAVLDRGDHSEPVVAARPPIRPRTFSRGAWPAVVAAAVVLIVFGVFAWVFGGGEPIQPVDSLPSPADRELGYYTTSNVPAGFVLQDIETLGGSRLLYVDEIDEVWVPSDGAFAIDEPFAHPAGLPEDLDEYLSQILESVPGSTQVEVAGEPGVIFETEFSQGDEAAQFIWVMGIDDQGGVFEISAIGMSRDMVMEVASGVHRIPLEEYLDLGSEIAWDVMISERREGSTYSVPVAISDVASDVDVALGIDLLWPRLAHANQGTTVITTEDGEVVESDGQSIQSNSAALFLEVPQDSVDALLSTYPGNAELSPEQRDERVDQYVEQVKGGQVLSEDPYVIQAVSGPEPRFDTSQLGEELPLVPSTSADVLPEFMFEEVVDDRPAATEARPVIILGTAGQPNSDVPAVTVLVWFTEAGATCAGRAIADGMGSGCGFEIMSRFGLGGESSDGEYRDMDYTVPLETSVVQIVTESQAYWQRPIGGYGVVPYGDTVERPTTIIAYDSEGDEIGNWQPSSG